MKKFSLILTSVAALFAVACTTDVTEDVGVQLGNDGVQTTLTLSLEESRTQLGKKAGDLYPLQWSEGDAIAVNGVASTALSSEWDGHAAANFTFPGELARPYNIVYPAPTEDAKVIIETIKETITETNVDPDTGEETVTTKEVDKEIEVALYPITFPASQTYAGAKLADGAAPMYGYADVLGEDEVAVAIPLNHLTGVLNFNIKGSETLSRIVITSEHGAISGTYYVRCETGQLVVKEESTSNQITLSFGEGLALKAEEATPVYVTVPAGQYGVFVATLHTVDGKKMAVRFDSDNKPISVGKVREFAPFTFVENTVDDAIFEIFDFADLQSFAEIASAAKFYPRVEAKLMDDIVVPEGAAWTPIDGFRYTFNGNDKKIVGLPAPLFGTTSGTIKDLTLEGVALVSNGELIMGSIANTLTSANQGSKASITNCKAVGTFTISNLEWKPTEDEDKSAAIVNYGGLVGRAYGADIIGCTNQVAVTVANLTATSNTLVIYPCIGGVLGFGDSTTLINGEVVESDVHNNTNDAAISYLCTSSAESKVGISRPHIGGILGCGNKGANLVGCENTANGAVTLNSHFHSDGGASGAVLVGGIAGYTNGADFKNCTNRAKIEADGIYKSINIGGVVGYSTYCYNEELHNYGEVIVKETARIRGTLAGGVAGAFYGNGSEATNDHYFKNCTNNAELKILASAEENWVNSVANGKAFYYRIGGIVGFGRIKTTGGCTNNGDITISGNIKLASLNKDKEELLAIAGCVGFKTSGTPTGVWTNNGDITVSASFTMDDDTAGATHPIVVAGVFGPHSGNNAEGINNGNITYNGKYAGATSSIHIGGVYAGGNSSNGYYGKTPKKAKNTGNITIGNEASTTKNVYVGGIQGYSSSTTVPDKFENTGNITFEAKATIGGTVYTGGIFGRFAGGNLKNLTNSGNIEVKCDLPSSKLCVGGIGALNVTGKTATDVVNTGNITLSGTYKKSVNVGGIFAEMANGNTSGTGLFTRVVNGALGQDGKPLDDKGRITVSGTCDYDPGSGATGENALCAAGIGGGNHYQYRLGSMDDCHNYGDIEISATIKGRCYLGGISVACPYNDRYIKNCSNQGDLIISGIVTDTKKGTIYQGGFSYTIDKTITFTNFQQKGNVIITETAQISETMYLDGYAYNVSGATLDGCSNSGNIIHNGQQKAETVYMGGISGYSIKSLTIKNGFTNSGKIAFGGTYSGGGGLYIAGLGLISGTSQKLTEAGLILNIGEVAYTGKSTHASGKVRVGGLFSSIPADVTTITAGENVNFVNTGKVLFSGTIANVANGAAGGISALTSSPITGAKAYCDVDASEGIAAGWVTGSVRNKDLPTAVNCHVGGVRLVWDDSDLLYKPEFLFTGENYFEYIYGSRNSTDWTGTTNYDGCQHLSSDPTVAAN